MEETEGDMERGVFSMQPASRVLESAMPHAVVFYPESLSLWFMGKLLSFARVRVMKGQVEKGELQLPTKQPFHL